MNTCNCNHHHQGGVVCVCLDVHIYFSNIRTYVCLLLHRRTSIGITLLSKRAPNFIVQRVAIPTIPTDWQIKMSSFKEKFKLWRGVKSNKNSIQIQQWTLIYLLSFYIVNSIRTAKEISQLVNENLKEKSLKVIRIFY